MSQVRCCTVSHRTNILGVSSLPLLFWVVTGAKNVSQLAPFPEMSASPEGLIENCAQSS